MSETSSVIDVLGLYILLAGFIIGLGAVTVIDTLGFLGRKSSYWTEATTRTHKVTKPLIWLGMTLATAGGVITFRDDGFTSYTWLQLIIVAALVANGVFLSFRVSPFLLNRENSGKSGELLPEAWQQKITVSFIISFFGWWTELLLVVLKLVHANPPLT